MQSRQHLSLPQANFEYSLVNEQQTRRSIEFAYDDLRQDIVATRMNTDKDASLGLRRHQFLLMGAT
jgi:hypothetical protein